MRQRVTRKRGEAGKTPPRPAPAARGGAAGARGGHRPKGGVSLERVIDRMVRTIVKEFNPERVILFGSQASGQAGPDSDVDLLIVMPVDGSKRERTIDIRQALARFTVPKDIIVTTPEDFAWRKDVVGTIEWPASREGKVLYVRS